MCWHLLSRMIQAQKSVLAEATSVPDPDSDPDQVSAMDIPVLFGFVFSGGKSEPSSV